MKHRIKEYLAYKGINPDRNNKICCPNPYHADKNPSASVYDERVTCHSACGKSWDVYDIAGFLTGHTEFIDQKKEVESVLGVYVPTEQPKPKTENNKYVALPYQKAKADFYTAETINELTRGFKNLGSITKSWPYKNEKGEVESVVVRFDSGDKKTVLTFYYNGQVVKMKGYPVLIYNRDKLAQYPEKPVLIVEGEKCAEIAEQLENFVPVTWNGGGAKVKYADWSIMKGRECYFWPDDDEPGKKVAAELKKLVPHVKEVNVFEELREIKPKGADIVEAFEYINDVSLVEEYILNNYERPPAEKKEPEPKPAPEKQTNALPFQILGISDDGKANFISTDDRLLSFNPTSITKTQLLNLMPLDNWNDEYGDDRQKWDKAASDIISISSKIDFDPDRIRGRGAWSEPDGRICYYDGKQKFGEYDPSRIFVRRVEKNIGIGGREATAKERAELYYAVAELTFETMADCDRTLGWCALAVVSGALPWRPAALLTGPSGSGKSTIVDEVVKPLTLSICCSGGESTAAGIRQRIGIDAQSIIIEESETDTPKKKQNRDDTFSLMRQSTSDDAPGVLKGTLDGRGMSFTLRSMFFFVAISPEIESEADENRTFRINLKKATYSREEWESRAEELKRTITPEVCAGVRAYTWNHLPEILNTANRIAPSVQKVGKMDNRTALADALLIAANMAVFQDNINPTTEEIERTLQIMYSHSPVERRRNENEEMLDRIMDEIIRDGKDSYSVSVLVEAVDKGGIETDDGGRMGSATHYRKLLGNHGIGVTSEGYIGIATNHHEIRRILQKGHGYDRQLKRHPQYVENKNVGLGGGRTKNCVVINQNGGR